MNWAPLHCAVKNSTSKAVELYLNHPKVDVNVLGSRNWTPIYCAVLQKFSDTVSLLLERKEIKLNITETEYG